MSNAIVRDSNEKQRGAVIGGIYDLAGKLMEVDKTRAAHLFSSAAKSWRQGLTSPSARDVAALKRAILKSGSLFREVAVASVAAGDRVTGADYWLRSSESFKQSIFPLAGWQEDARDQGPVRAGSLYRDLAVEAAGAGDRAKAAEFWMKCAESFEQSPLPLSDWQMDARDGGAMRAGALYRELAIEAAQSGDKMAAAHCWLKAAECFGQSRLPLSDWQQDARDRGPIRAGSYYRDLAVAGQDTGDAESAAECWLKCAASFRKSPLPLSDWQQDACDRGTIRAGGLYRDLAVATAKADNKGTAAAFWLKSAECFRQSALRLSDWQQDARDRGPVRGGALYRDLALEAQKAGEQAHAAQYWLLAAQSFMQAAVPLTDWQADVRDQGLSRAVRIFSDLAVKAEKHGEKAMAADFWLRASESLSQASSQMAASPSTAQHQPAATPGITPRDNWLSKLKKLAN